MKKIFVLTLSFFLILTIYLYFNKENNNTFISSIQNERVAYYVDNSNDGYDKQNTIPIGNYVINEEKSKCLSGGKISDYNSSLGTIKYILNSADKCIVYFEALPSLNLGSVTISGSNVSQNITMVFENEQVLAYRLLSDNSTTYSNTTC